MAISEEKIRAECARALADGLRVILEIVFEDGHSYQVEAKSMKDVDDYITECMRHVRREW
jgi:hypothetical protein